MSDNKNSSGMSLGGVTCLVLIILKIAGVISMPWIWVITSFIWATVLWIIIILFVIFMFATLGAVFASIFR